MAKKILLIEDEDLLINLLEKKLAGAGYLVSLARNGQQGMELMRQNNPDIVLLDIIMPKMGGFEVLEEKAKDDLLRNIPVIIISNSGQPVELDRAKKLGAKDWLIKTEFDPQEVLDKVINQIGK
jgi:CheY-like chemotaxis protein